ncbi:MAG: cobalamin-binding protein [Halieaceae bacterium]|jgi:iron complex transport system substrate-binding protein|nr:cobalamin-binding protein [Halieaceae bacterium]
MNGRRFKLVTVVIALLACAQAWSQPVSVVDFNGRLVSLDAPARRIVALAPHSVENLFSAGAGQALVGKVSSSDYPPEAGEVSLVGTFNAYSLEAIAALQPDLIVMWGSGNGAGTLGKLEVLGIPIFVSEPRRLEDIPRDIRALGLLAGTVATSEAEARRIEQGLATLRAGFSQESRIRVLYEIWNDPLQTINGDHLISQVISLCGGHNVFADAPTLAPRVNIESVLALAPQAIVASGMSNSRPHWLDEWRRYPSLPAVRDNGLFFIHPDLLERPTARVLLGAQSLCEQLATLRDLPPGDPTGT